MFIQAHPGQNAVGYDLGCGLMFSLSKYVVHHGKGRPVCLAGDGICQPAGGDTPCNSSSFPVGYDDEALSARREIGNLVINLRPESLHGDLVGLASGNDVVADDARRCQPLRSCRDIVQFVVVKGVGKIHVPANACILCIFQVVIDDAVGHYRADDDCNGCRQGKADDENMLQPPVG